MSEPPAIQIRRLLTGGGREIQGLSDVLIDCVEGAAYSERTDFPNLFRRTKAVHPG